MAQTSVALTTNGRRSMAVLLVAAAVLIAAYWAAWFAHRSLVASETTVPYMQFENAFPLADGWLALCLVAGAWCLQVRRRAALLWLLAGGGGLYLFGVTSLTAEAASFFSGRLCGRTGQSSPENVASGVDVGVGSVPTRQTSKHCLVDAVGLVDVATV
jgi:hypothetical protein